VIRVGLIGRGLAGTVFHAPLIAATESMELVATVGSAGARDLLLDPAIDLIVVATPNASHFELARLALENGKHVIIDKPFVTSSDEADVLITLAASRGRMLTIFHNRRWDGDFLTVQEQIASGSLGEIPLFEAHWDRFRPVIKDGWKEVPKGNVGLLWDLGPHLIDQMLVLFGNPDAVQADIASQRADALVDDYFLLTFSYGQSRVVLGASTLITHPRPRFAVHGTKGSFVKYGIDPQEAALRDCANPLAHDFGEDQPEFYGQLFSSDSDHVAVPTLRGRYLEFYEAAAASINDSGPPPVDPLDARIGIRIIEAARHSATTGQRVAFPKDLSSTISSPPV
jgi:scyllo-inositol 2-dehydrogenase (NADP+)